MSIIKCYKLKCEVCGIEGTVQVFYNKAGQLKYGRVRHYLELNEAKKPVFEYHRQSKEYLTEKLEFILANIDQHDDLNQMNADQKLKDLKSVYTKQDSRMGRSSSLVRTLALRAKGRRFKSGPAHSHFGMSPHNTFMGKPPNRRLCPPRLNASIKRAQ
jgi:hypothetical protein